MPKKKPQRKSVVGLLATAIERELFISRTGKDSVAEDLKIQLRRLLKHEQIQCLALGIAHGVIQQAEDSQMFKVVKKRQPLVGLPPVKTKTIDIRDGEYQDEEDRHP